MSASSMAKRWAKILSTAMDQVHSSAAGIGSGLQVFSAFFAIGLSLALAGFCVCLALTLRRLEVRRLCS